MAQTFKPFQEAPWIDMLRAKDEAARAKTAAKLQRRVVIRRRHGEETRLEEPFKVEVECRGGEDEDEAAPERGGLDATGEAGEIEAATSPAAPEPGKPPAPEPSKPPAQELSKPPAQEPSKPPAQEPSSEAAPGWGVLISERGEEDKDIRNFKSDSQSTSMVPAKETGAEEGGDIAPSLPEAPLGGSFSGAAQILKPKLVFIHTRGHAQTRAEVKAGWDRALSEARGVGGDMVVEAIRMLCREDLFFLLTQVLMRRDLDREWLFRRCEDVMARPDGRLYLWAREHGKSSIITFGKTIQDILIDPEVTVGIFSHTRPIAKAFLKQIKYEFETNVKLKALFPEILYENPRSESPKWSEDEGITVKRTGNTKEATVEAWGLVDGQPTSKHFDLMVYDDVVTEGSVSTPEQIKKTTEAWELSRNLASSRLGNPRMRVIGTKYHYNDTYATVADRGAVEVDFHPATMGGKLADEPVLLTREQLEQKYREMGPRTFACQMLLDPKSDDIGGFDEKWLRYWPAGNFDHLNLYILVDPASKKKKTSDYTAFTVVGLGPDRKYYVVEFFRDRMNLTERIETVMQLHQTYRPLGVGYEEYGLQADREHLEYIQTQRNYRFEVTPMGGNLSKIDRIRKLEPLFAAGDIYLPHRCVRRMYDGQEADMTQVFVKDEFKAFPVSAHDDMLDCLARIRHPDFITSFPMSYEAPRKVLTQAERDWAAITGNSDGIFGQEGSRPYCFE